MSKPGLLIRVAFRELWPTAAATLALGGIGVLVSWLLGSISTPPERQGSVADLPMMLAPLWGGVVIAASSPGDQVFRLARPVGRLTWLSIQLAVLFGAVTAAAIVVNLVGAAIVPSALLPSPGGLVGALLAALCGLFSGSLIQEKMPALGLAWVLAMLSNLAPTVTATNLLEHSLSRQGVMFTADFLLGIMVLNTFSFAVPVYYYWRSWSPLRTSRSSLITSMLLMAGMALTTLAAVLASPSFVQP